MSKGPPPFIDPNMPEIVLAERLPNHYEGRPFWLHLDRSVGPTGSVHVVFSAEPQALRLLLQRMSDELQQLESSGRLSGERVYVHLDEQSFGTA